MLASSLPGGPSRPTPAVGSAREAGTAPTPGTMVLLLNKYTLAQTHKGGGTLGEESLSRRSFVSQSCLVCWDTGFAR